MGGHLEPQTSAAGAPRRLQGPREPTPIASGRIASGRLFHREPRFPSRGFFTAFPRPVDTGGGIALHGPTEQVAEGRPIMGGGDDRRPGTGVMATSCESHRGSCTTRRAPPTAPSAAANGDFLLTSVEYSTPPRSVGPDGCRMAQSAPKRNHERLPRGESGHSTDRSRAKAVIGVWIAVIRSGKPSAGERSALHGRQRDRLSADPKSQHDGSLPAARRPPHRLSSTRQKPTECRG